MGKIFALGLKLSATCDNQWLHVNWKGAQYNQAYGWAIKFNPKIFVYSLWRHSLYGISVRTKYLIHTVQTVGKPSKEVEATLGVVSQKLLNSRNLQTAYSLHPKIKQTKPFCGWMKTCDQSAGAAIYLSQLSWRKIESPVDGRPHPQVGQLEGAACSLPTHPWDLLCHPSVPAEAATCHVK